MDNEYYIVGRRESLLEGACTYSDAFLPDRNPADGTVRRYVLNALEALCRRWGRIGINNLDYAFNTLCGTHQS